MVYSGSDVSAMFDAADANNGGRPLCAIATAPSACLLVTCAPVPSPVFTRVSPCCAGGRQPKARAVRRLRSTARFDGSTSMLDDSMDHLCGAGLRRYARPAQTLRSAISCTSASARSPHLSNLTVTASGCAQASYVENLKALDAACGDDIRVSPLLLDVARG